MTITVKEKLLQLGIPLQILPSVWSRQPCAGSGDKKSRCPGWPKHRISRAVKVKDAKGTHVADKVYCTCSICKAEHVYNVLVPGGAAELFKIKAID